MLATLFHSTIETHADNDAWLDARRSMIGASESAALFGEGYAGQSTLTVWAEKTRGDLAEEFEREELIVGKLLEPGLRAILAHKTGLEIEHPGDFTIFRHAEKSFIGATLDAIVFDDDGPQPGELKNVSTFAGRDWREDNVPLKFAVQCNHQMFVTGAKRCYLLGLIGGNKPHVRILDRNDRFIEKTLLPRLEWFWQYVKSNVMPPIDGSEATGEALRRLWPDDDGSQVALPDELAEEADRLADAKEAIKAAEEAATLAQNRLMAAIGEHSYGVLPDGRRFSWKWQERREHVVKASRFRVFRMEK